MKFRFRDDRGAALVEVALWTGLIFLPLVMGTFEVARLAYYSIEVENSARAGASYGSVNLGNAYNNQTTIKQAAKNDARDLANLVATPDTSCVCETVTHSNGTTTTSFSSAMQCKSSNYPACNSDNATSTQYSIQYTTVSTSANVSTLFTIPGFPSTRTLGGYSALRVLGN